jgi:hypothetical protein
VDIERPRHRLRLSPHFRHSFVTHATTVFCIRTWPHEARLWVRPKDRSAARMLALEGDGE